MGLFEDAETLAAPRQPDVTLKLLAFRDHVRELLGSELFAEFAAGREDWRAVLRVLSGDLKSDLALDNFLLPGNMEDGADKSRHWNAFGGICL